MPHLCKRGGQKGLSDPWRCKLPSLGARNRTQAFFMISVASGPPLSPCPAFMQAPRITGQRWTPEPLQPPCSSWKSDVLG